MDDKIIVDKVNILKIKLKSKEGDKRIMFCKNCGIWFKVNNLEYFNQLFFSRKFYKETRKEYGTRLEYFEEHLKCCDKPLLIWLGQGCLVTVTQFKDKGEMNKYINNTLLEKI